MGHLAEPYRRAAVAYAAYGCVYLAGAVIQLTPERQRDFFGFVPWWVFYVAGAALVAGLPVLIWRRRMWFTRILAFFPVIKAVTLLIQQDNSDRGTGMTAGRKQTGIILTVVIFTQNG